MNIQTVIANLDNTIKGKEAFLTLARDSRKVSTSAELIAVEATIQFLEINIDELKRIRGDLVMCLAKEPEFNENDSDEVRQLISQGR